MYIVTFYSFKGGTGRTMALANVAVELAMRGRRVLLVDFDLEAPGLDTYPFGRAETRTPGIVDFVKDYLVSGEAPDVQSYVYETAVGANNQARLWIMPAGAQDEQYDTRLRSIDWQRLYEQQSGFLLFEDLKAQWEKGFHPDYVLVDSRTGLTDTGGICTRQLPDAVVVLFFPNEQNRRGLKGVVDEIRQEHLGPLKKKIQLHFVMANVPDLDDEQEILSRNVIRLQETLQYEQLAATIHHYDSLALLNQTIFVLERSRSRLAQEYRQLTASIIRENIQDEEGAVAYLDDVLRHIRNRRASSQLTSIEENLQDIKARHVGNPEVLRRLARLRRRQRKPDEALILLDQAVAAGSKDSEVFLSRAELHASARDRQSAVRDLEYVLQLSDVPVFDLTVATRMLVRLGASDPETLSSSPAIAALNGPGAIEVAKELETKTDTLPAAERILRAALHKERQGSTVQDVRSELMLSLIGQGKFQDAMSLIGTSRPHPQDLDIYDGFNYAMAEWGQSMVIAADFMDRVLEIDRDRPPSNNPNYHQCIAIASWATGEIEKARERSETALRLMQTRQDTAFSAWSYLYVTAEQFIEDIRSMNEMFCGKQILPGFISRTHASKVQT